MTITLRNSLKPFGVLAILSVTLCPALSTAAPATKQVQLNAGSTASPSTLANPRQTRASAQAVNKSVKTLSVLERAWNMRSQSLIKKLAFVEQLQKEIETQPHTPENLGRVLLAQAVVLDSEESGRLAASELLRRAAETSRLSFPKQTIAQLWSGFQKNSDPHSTRNFTRLSNIVWALSTSGHNQIDENWDFFLALAHINRNQPAEALEALRRVDLKSALYRMAKLQEGLMLARAGETRLARIALEVVMTLATTTAENDAEFKHDFLLSIKEHAALNLARLAFEGKDFKEAIALYRTIDAQSPLFYESLSEQSWAFFLAGHPNRALGIGYGATSPFFNAQFQPEQYYMSAAVNYWLCDFSSAMRSIQAFVVHSKDEARHLNGWKLQGQLTDPENQALVNRAYTLVDDLMRGVQSEHTAIGPKARASLAQQENLIAGFKQLSETQLYRQKLSQAPWPLRTKKLIVDALIQNEQEQKRQLGLLTLSRIIGMQKQYQRALDQIRIIHLEIMMAEKDKLMNNPRSAQGQQFMGNELEFVETNTQAAKTWVNDKREFWKDELDSFVFSKKSQCKQTSEGRDQYAEK